MSAERQAKVAYYYDKDNCVVVLTEQMQTEEGQWGKFSVLMVYLYI